MLQKAITKIIIEEVLACNLCNLEYDQSYMFKCIDCSCNICRFCCVVCHDKTSCICENCKPTHVLNCSACNSGMIKCGNCNDIILISDNIGSIKTPLTNQDMNYSKKDVYCDICNKQNCMKCYVTKKITHIDLNIIQYVKMCKQCVINPELIIKCQYLLITNSLNNKSEDRENHEILAVLETLLLTANSKHKYINKYCMTYIIIPEIITYYINHRQKYCKCKKCKTNINKYMKCDKCLVYCKGLKHLCVYCGSMACVTCRDKQVCRRCKRIYCHDHGQRNDVCYLCDDDWC